MIWDALGYRPRDPLMIDMTPQQKQAAQQPPPAIQAKTAMQQAQMQADQTKHQQANQTKLINTLLNLIFGHAGKLADLDDSHLQHLQQLASDHILAQQSQQQDAQEPAGGQEAA